MARYELKNERRDNAKRRLSKYIILIEKNEQRLKCIADCESRQLSTTQQYEETRCSGVAKDAMADNLAAEEEHASYLVSAGEEYNHAWESVERIVDRVFEIDSLAGRVLARRYLISSRQPELYEIAEELNYEYATIRNAHIKGLDIAADIIDSSTYDTL